MGRLKLRSPNCDKYAVQPVAGKQHIMGLLFSSEEIQGPVNPSSSQSSFEDAKKDTDYIKALGLKDRAKAAIIGAFVADSLSAYSSNCDENDEAKFLSNFEEQEQIFGAHNSLEPSPHSRHLGHQSFYGEEAFPFLRLISTRYVQYFVMGFK